MRANGGGDSGKANGGRGGSGGGRNRHLELQCLRRYSGNQLKRFRRNWAEGRLVEGERMEVKLLVPFRGARGARLYRREREQRVMALRTVMMVLQDAGWSARLSGGFYASWRMSWWSRRGG